jgi:hypothetical protein
MFNVFQIKLCSVKHYVLPIIAFLQIEKIFQVDYFIANIAEFLVTQKRLAGTWQTKGNGLGKKEAAKYCRIDKEDICPSFYLLFT